MSARNPRATRVIQAAIGANPARGVITALADAAGVTPSTASRWVSGMSSPDATHWPAIDAHLGTDLVDGADEGDPLTRLEERLTDLERAANEGLAQIQEIALRVVALERAAERRPRRGSQ